MGLLLSLVQLIHSQEQGGTERTKVDLFSVTRRADRSKDPRLLKSYLDLVCSQIHRPGKDSLRVDLETRLPHPENSGSKGEIGYLS